MAKRSKKKTVTQYKRVVDEFSEFSPFMKKFRRRKTLKPWEKSYITRVSNRVTHSGGINVGVKALSKKQAKRLKDKKAIIGHGVRGLSFRRFDKDSKVHLRGNEFLISSKDRLWHHVQVQPADLLNFFSKGDDLLSKHVGRTVALWSARGSNYEGFPKFEGAAGLGAEIVRYFSAYIQHDEWLLGFAYYDA